MTQRDPAPVIPALAVLLVVAAALPSQEEKPAGRHGARSRGPAAHREGVHHPDETLLGSIRQLTFHGKRSGEAYFHPDGERICFQSVRGDCPHYQIFVKRLDGTRLVRITPGKGLTTCSYFHPTRPRMIWASTHLDPESYVPPPEGRANRYRWEKHPSFDVFSSDLEGGDVRRLTDTPGYDAECSYSPDGSRICFTSERDGDYEIHTMKADGTDVRRITHAKGYDGGPFYSPDGTRICFRGFRDPENPRHAQIYVIDADGTDERRLTDVPAANWAPFWHPSGEHLVYSRNVGSHRNFELFVVPAAGGESVRVTHHPAADVLPVFSPDGSKLMWTSTRATGRSQVFIADFSL